MPKLEMKSKKNKGEWVATARSRKILDKIISTRVSPEDHRVVSMSGGTSILGGCVLYLTMHQDIPTVFRDEIGNYWHSDWFESPPVRCVQDGEEDEDEE